jgi:hypothetical protein
VRRALSVLLPAVVLLAGCGTSRTIVPSLTRPLPPTGFREVRYSQAGVALRAPVNWGDYRSRAPLVASLASGNATIALWRYPRTTPPPADAAALEQARQALVAAARARDPGLTVIRSRAVQIDGAGGVELNAIERIDGAVRRVRSTHVYEPGAEIVLEEFAPPALFHWVDHVAFSPVRHSLRLLATP